MWFARKPSPAFVRTFLDGMRDDPFSYEGVGATRSDTPHAPQGYLFDLNRRHLGQGHAAFDAACDALRRWEMFSLGWVEPGDPTAPLVAGTPIAMMARTGGLWCLNACRIVYEITEETAPMRRFGFAYGTLPHHVERGEERFTIEWREDDSVWYDLRAFSRPHRWYTWAGYPFTRRLQRRFVAGSLDAMSRAVARQ